VTDNAKKSVESAEHLIENYIFEKKLADGARLPSAAELAAQLMCDEEFLVESLRGAEATGRLSYKDGVWTVVSPKVLQDHSFSFTSSARARDLRTVVVEAGKRLPIHDRDDPYYRVEQRVCQELGVPADSQLIVIDRVRLLGGRPGAFQRAYLDPARFPDSFVNSHDFSKESLIALYQQCGYRLLSRDTVLEARAANLYEKNAMQQYVPRSQVKFMLDAEQRLYAEDSKDKSRFVLEFLKASYPPNWRYEIKNRPASAQP
jgi:DNA-binding GntR family transcriptional regulator